jgi:hypothetical protein
MPTRQETVKKIIWLCKYYWLTIPHTNRQFVEAAKKINAIAEDMLVCKICSQVDIDYKHICNPNREAEQDLMYK